MLQFPGLTQDWLTAELDYRRERLTGTRFPGRPRVHRMRGHRNRVRAAG